MRWPWRTETEELSPPNVPPDWIDRHAWAGWNAPRNAIAGEGSYAAPLWRLAGPTCRSGYCLPVQVRLTREPSNRHEHVRISESGRPTWSPAPHPGRDR